MGHNRLKGVLRSRKDMWARKRRKCANNFVCMLHFVVLSKYIPPSPPTPSYPVLSCFELVRSLPVRSRTKLTRDVFDTLATHSPLVYDVTSCFRHLQTFNRQDEKSREETIAIICVSSSPPPPFFPSFFLLSTPVDRALDTFALRFLFQNEHF